MDSSEHVSQEGTSTPSPGSLSFRIDHNDTNLVSGIRRMGKTHLVKTLIAGSVGRVQYHPDARRICSLKPGYHHIIDDFDKIPITQLPDLMDAVLEISMAGRHSNTGLTIIVHHPTWTSKYFRLTPDNIFAFRQPKTDWYKDFFDKDTLALIRRLPKHDFVIYSGEYGIYQCRLERRGRLWDLVGSRMQDTQGTVPEIQYGE